MLSTGTILANRYEILEKIGTGGMSDVYKALDHSLGREVAIKVLKAEFSQDSTFVSKFRAEAQSAAVLEHPNIVNIYDVGSEDGLYYIVMEYVEGITLKNYIATKGRLGYNEAISIAIQVAKGIEAAHNKGIVHQDIKPQNIIISKDGKVKVTDFGIARAATSNTIHADMMGSVHYISPEQARNGFVTYSSDIYSLGIVMYEMVTGRVPFDGDTTVAIAIQHIQSPITPPEQYAPGLPIAVSRIIQKCTMKSPERRYESVSALLVDLKKALMHPDEDFIVIPDNQPDMEKTRVITKDEEDEIRKQTNHANDDPLPEDDEDDDKDEGPINPKMDKAITIMGIAAAVVIVAIIIFMLNSVFGIFKFGKGRTNSDSTEQTTQISVPDLDKMTFEEARAALTEKGLEIRKGGEEASDDYDKGQILNQEPAAGEKVDPGTTIVVTICSGEGDTEIPSVTGKTEAEAKSELEAAGFEVSTKESYSDDVEKGYVMSQTPVGGEKGKEGDTVIITISRGAESVDIPNVVGKSQSAATSTLENAGFAAGDISEAPSDTYKKGTVMAQDPKAGSKAGKGAKVNLVISTGQATYSFSDVVEPADTDNYNSNYVVLRDAKGNAIRHWTISQATDVSASGITTATGTIAIYSDSSMDEELSSYAVSFKSE
ncbi:MAG: Stk1 family PASTA domain-containing Ser/Thr kinase [Lachnospiraceae bacterium]|nr:Stk1 family PASTA domain-containing Ser/Thr kinase [Lachnospiraceae bacterium]MDD7327731.1 Stk1 family PASTA domain-containing Ser/Thr kinase [Lachnospiraceae bacterium]MDY2758790.1 Stk1 family PASTA domain-containing Ser/Thr kinase [Lachnospiraceae bacterium]